MENSSYGKFLIWKIPPMENSSYGKFLLWKIPPMENSSYGKFLQWKIPPMENSTYGKFNLWKIPPTENSTYGKLNYTIFFFSKFFYAEKQCSRQFWNAVEREPVKLESSILPGAKGASSETT